LYTFSVSFLSHTIREGTEEDTEPDTSADRQGVSPEDIVAGNSGQEKGAEL
jgi:hypothetical protein